MPVQVEGTLDLSGILADGRIKEDGDLTISVNPFYYDISGTKGYYQGSVGNSVDDGYTSYVYLDGYTNLIINTTGYPAFGNSHIRLGRVIAAGGFITRVISERALLTDSSLSADGVPTSREVIAGSGLTGGGALDENVTLNVAANADGSIVVNANDIQVGVLATDAQHGDRGGGNLHAEATISTAGFLSAADKLALDTLVLGNTTLPIRNETGHPLLKGRAVAVVGWSVIHHVKLVDYADKDDENLRPAIAILQAEVANNTTATATTQGLIEDINTSMWSLTDQLVLGNDGYLIRPPLDNISFTTGEIQNLASTARIDAVDGHLLVALDGLEAVTASELWALQGTYGSPSGSNKYVTDTDPRANGLINGVYFYPKSATNPTSPTPQDGYEYYNTALKEVMRYDSSRSKWLSISEITLLGGRSRFTAAGSFYRGIDGLTFGTNIGYTVPKGTLVGLSYTKTDSLASYVEVLVNGSVIATLYSNIAGPVYNWSANADFNEGLLQFRNQVGGNTTTNVQIVAIIKRRI